MKPAERVDVAVVGAGPAGLTTAYELRNRGVPSVVVLERETAPGGIPRHSDHTGYGVRDLRRVMTGPSYARRLADRAVEAGADVRVQSMVTGWADDSSLWVTSPAGRYRLAARAVVLATGARERSRAARLVPGDRPSGVFTTGHLQNLVHEHGQKLGGTAVVVGAELVSWSAVLTLRDAGCRAVLMTTEHSRPESYAAFTVPGRLALSLPVATRTKVTRVIGRDRVRAVEVEDVDSGIRRVVACDVVVFTGDWIPDHELARMRGVVMDGGHFGPVVDTSLQTSADGVFAAGNVVHPVDTADVAAIDGRFVARQVARRLNGGPSRWGGIRLTVREPFVWVSPAVISSPTMAPPRSRVLLWSAEFRVAPLVEVRQGSTLLARRRLPWPVSPGRVFRVPWSLFEGARVDQGDVVVALA